MTARHISGALLLALPCVVLAQSSQTVWDGIYTAEQAQRGESSYATRCAGCHGVNLEGKPDPSLVGGAFIDRWREDSLGTLYNHISTRMPARAPGSLPESTYVDILAFILRSNEIPPGAQPLTAAATAGIRLVGQNGAQPLPSGAVVLVVGCFTAGPKNTWVLTRSTEPVRTRTVDETDAEEIRRSAAMPPGSRTIRLQNLDFFRSDFNPEPYQDQRVQVKGPLTLQTNNDRINVTSLEKTGSACPAQ